MIPRWLARHLKYACVSTSVLRGMYRSLQVLGVLSNQRAAIAYELSMRAWAEAVEARLDEQPCVWTSRGGRS